MKVLTVCLGLVASSFGYGAAPSLWSSPSGPGPDVTINKGGDLLAVNANLKLELPANFFAPGSSPWTGVVSASGVPIGTYGAFELGTTAFVLERRNVVVLSGSSGSTERVLAKPSALALACASPITVTVGSGTQTWQVTARMGSTPASTGWYDLTGDATSGGTFTAQIELPLVVDFESSIGSRSFDCGVVVLSASSCAWTTLESSPTAPLAVTGLPLGVALSGTLVSSAVDLFIEPAGELAGRPGPGYVDPTANVMTSAASLGRGCSIGAMAVVEAGAVIGPFAVIGDGAYIGANAIVGDHSSIGSNCSVWSAAVVDSYSVIASGCSIGAASVVGPRCNVASACQIGEGVKLRGRCVLRPGCSVGDGALLEKGVRLGGGVTIAAGIEIAESAVVANGVSQTTSIVTLIGEDGSQWAEPLPESGLASSECGVIQQDSSLRHDMGSSGGGEAMMASDSPPSPGNLPPGYGALPGHIGTDIARPKCGGTGQEYSANYMCAWYAEQLRQKLAALGYSTTFTCVSDLNPDYAWYKPWQDKWINGHAMVDIHWPNGTVTWIEAQWPGSKAVDSRIGALDGNGDGVVTYFDGVSVDDTSDGNKCVEVYGSRAEAAAAGSSLPGN